MTIRSKRQAQAIVVAFDFTDYLERVGFPNCEYTSLVDVGLTVYRAEVRGSVVLLTLGAGVAGQNYQAAVRGNTSLGGALTLAQTVYVSRDVQVGIVGQTYASQDYFAQDYAA